MARLSFGAALLLKPANNLGFEKFSVAQDDLHIGIFDGESRVFSFCAAGIVAEHRDPLWLHSLVLCDFCPIEEFPSLPAQAEETKTPSILGNVDPKAIMRFCRSNQCLYTLNTYDAISFNCFNFVIDFCSTLLPSSPIFRSKELFVRCFVEKPLRARLNRNCNCRRRSSPKTFVLKSPSAETDEMSTDWRNVQYF